MSDCRAQALPWKASRIFCTTAPGEVSLCVVWTKGHLDEPGEARSTIAGGLREQARSASLPKHFWTSIKGPSSTAALMTRRSATLRSRARTCPCTFRAHMLQQLKPWVKWKPSVSKKCDQTHGDEASCQLLSLVFDVTTLEPPQRDAIFCPAASGKRACTWPEC